MKRSYIAQRAPNTTVELIAKLEAIDCLANMDAIIEAADGIMVARGDLGAQVRRDRGALGLHCGRFERGCAPLRLKTVLTTISAQSAQQQQPTTNSHTCRIPLASHSHCARIALALHPNPTTPPGAGRGRPIHPEVRRHARQAAGQARDGRAPAAALDDRVPHPNQGGGEIWGMVWDLECA